MSHIRIESHEKVVTDAKVFYVDGDNEIDISSCVQVVDLHLGVGELATATLQTIIGHASATAQIEDVLVSHMKKPVGGGMTRIKESLTRMAELPVWFLGLILVLLVVDMIDDENWIGLAVVWIGVVLSTILSRRAER